MKGNRMHSQEIAPRRTCVALLLSLSLLLVGVTGARAEDDDGDGGWLPITLEVNDVAGLYRWSVDWDITFHYERFDRTLPDGSGLFVDRHVDRKARLPSMPLVTRDTPGIDEIPGGANVSMASMPPSTRLPGCGGEIYRDDPATTAHQRDWDALVALRDRVFEEGGVTTGTPLREKARLIADWARNVNPGGPIYESKHPVDLVFHPSFCAGRSNAFVAIMHTMGIPARTVNMNTHSVAEVFLDGRWYYVENIRGRDTDSRKTATFMPCSLMAFYADPEAHGEHTSESHIASPYFRSKDLHNGRANWQLGALWKWHFIQCARGDDMMMRDTMKNGSGIAVTLNGATCVALYPNAPHYYYKVLEGNAPVMTNYQKHGWYCAGHRVLQGDWIRKRFYIGDLDAPDNPVTKVTSRLHLMGGDTQTFAIPPVFTKDPAGWTLKVGGKSYPLSDWKGWRLVKGFEPVAMVPFAYFEFELHEEDLTENGYTMLEFGSRPTTKYREQHVHVRIFPDPVEPYVNPHKPYDTSRTQEDWRIITDQKWDLLQMFEYAR